MLLLAIHYAFNVYEKYYLQHFRSYSSYIKFIFLLMFININQIKHAVLINKEMIRSNSNSLKIDKLIYFIAPLIILVPFYTYYMAVYKQKSAKPFPHSTITQTATKYPQNISFRFITGIGSSIVALFLIVIRRWINTQAQKSSFPKMSSFFQYLMFFGVFCMCIATQTIDSKDTGPLHTPSAVFFFIILEIYIFYTTFYLHQLYQWDSSITTSRSLLHKRILCAYVTLTWVYCLYGNFYEKDSKVDFSVVLEWNAYFVSFMWVFSFFQQWKNIELKLSWPRKEEQMMQV